MAHSQYSPIVSEERVRGIIEDLAAQNATEGSLEQKVGDYYNSFMDTATINSKGIEPIRPLLDRIAAIDSREALTEAFGRAGKDGTNTPIGAGIGIDRENPDRYQLNVSAAGLGLPDRDFYLQDNERFNTIRAAYQENIATMLGFAGMGADAAAASAEAIVAVETKIAEKHWPRADRRDRDKTHNPMGRDQLNAEYAGFDWDRYFSAASYQAAQSLNVNHPSAVKEIIEIVNETEIDTWKAYLTYHLVRSTAFVLSEEIDEANFAFAGKVLRGQPQQRDRWKRAVGLVGGRQSLGEALGQIYVDKYFPESSKEQMQVLVENLRTALGQRIDNLDWMGDATKVEARAKLASFRPKIAYPDKWQDFSAIDIDPDDLAGNVKRVGDFFYDLQVERLNEQTDRDQWFMTPQTVNAYYNPSI